MSERWEDQLARVRMMSEDERGAKWDLSVNDRAALKAVLDQIEQGITTSIGEITSRYVVEERVREKDSGQHKLVELTVQCGEIEVGRLVVMSGPAADVDEFLEGKATLAQIADRWKHG